VPSGIAAEAPDLRDRPTRAADLALQFRVEPIPVDRLSDAYFDDLFAFVDCTTIANVDCETSRRSLDQYRGECEPKTPRRSPSLLRLSCRCGSAEKMAGERYRSCGAA
jgi:hypothetical protein